MSGMVNQIVLTALDGVLLNSLEDCVLLQPLVDRLKASGVPVIIFTERDRAEVEPIRQRLGLTSPFITESGSGIFTPVDANPFDPPLGEQDGAYYVEELGCPYVQARAALRVIANLISYPLKGFGDFTVEQLQRSAGISAAAAHQAKAREFSEPFMTPKAVQPDKLHQAAEEMGFRIVLWRSENGRFSELVGGQAGLAPAAERIIAAYQRPLPTGEPLKVMGISDRLEDLTILANASSSFDWKGIWIAPEETDSHVHLPDCTTVVNDLAPTGWIAAVQSLIA